MTLFWQVAVTFSNRVINWGHIKISLCQIYPWASCYSMHHLNQKKKYIPFIYSMTLWPCNSVTFFPNIITNMSSDIENIRHDLVCHPCYSMSHNIPFTTRCGQATYIYTLVKCICMWSGARHPHTHAATPTHDTYGGGLSNAWQMERIRPTPIFL